MVPQVPAGISQGAALYTAKISFILDLSPKGDYEDLLVDVSWDDILKYVGPALINECSDDEFIEKLKLCFYHKIQDVKSKEKVLLSSVIIPHMIVDQIKIQLRALGQMAPGNKRRAVADRKNYWRLTSLGESRLLNLQAIRSNQ